MLNYEKFNDKYILDVEYTQYRRINEFLKNSLPVEVVLDRLDEFVSNAKINNWCNIFHNAILLSSVICPSTSVMSLSAEDTIFSSCVAKTNVVL